MKKNRIINKEISPKSELFWDIEDAAILAEFSNAELDAALADDRASARGNTPRQRKCVAALALTTRLDLAG